MSLFYQIRDLRRFGRYVALFVAKTIATALVSSILDNCYFLLNSTANKDIAKRQCPTLFGKGSPRFSRSVSLLKSLH